MPSGNYSGIYRYHHQSEKCDFRFHEICFYYWVNKSNLLIGNIHTWLCRSASLRSTMLLDLNLAMLLDLNLAMPSLVAPDSRGLKAGDYLKVKSKQNDEVENFYHNAQIDLPLNHSC
eukprot:Gregarina_sp_Poly_1__3398@NODE_1984_length_2938_cov_32_688610_g1278_i0_p2_GENE_NODE_1984_length_2938_cov_32_688610_g1278_i0NODE_1984_length_2938_cov_32_688610_g1278_i0_p2_ORF_typecomplete_len117_score2_89FANCL_C/PF11793_8/0_066_NODE_1984_length_2938_cov_32_688610_g1278_i015181868